MQTWHYCLYVLSLSPVWAIKLQIIRIKRKQISLPITAALFLAVPSFSVQDLCVSWADQADPRWSHPPPQKYFYLEFLSTAHLLLSKSPDEFFLPRGTEPETTCYLQEEVINKDNHMLT